MNKGICTR